MRSPELCGDRIAYLIIYFPERFSIDLTNPAEASARHQIAIGVEVLRLGEISEDIIFFVDEGQVEGFWPEGDIDQRVAGFVCIIVEVIDPGAFHRAHIFDQVIDGGGIVAIFAKCILQAGLADGEFIDVGERIRRQFK